MQSPKVLNVYENKKWNEVLLAKTSFVVVNKNQFAQTYSSFKKKNPLLHHQPLTSSGISMGTCHNTTYDDIPMDMQSTLVKKRAFLEELKARITKQKQNNILLKQENHLLNLYFKKSELLAKNLAVSCQEKHNMRQTRQLRDLHQTSHDKIDQNNNQIILNRIYELEALLLRLLLKILKKFECFQTQQTENQSKYLQSELKKNKLQKQIQQLQKLSTTLKNELQSQKKKQQQFFMKNSKLNCYNHFEKFKLESEIHRISHQLDQTLNNNTYKIEKLEIQEDLDNAKRKIEALENQKLVLTENLDYKIFQVKGLLQNNLKLNEKIKQLVQKSDMKMQQLKLVEIELKRRKEAERYRENWLMASEEIEHLKVNKLQLEGQLKKIIRKYKIVKEKLSNFMQKKSIQVNQDVGYEKEDLLEIMKVINKNQITHTRAALTYFKPELVDHIISQHQQILNKQETIETHLNEYKAGRANFFIFLESYEQRITYQIKHLKTRNISLDFFIKLRAIFDSKYNEFCFEENHKEWKRFPDFTIGFLERYELNKNFRKVQENINSKQIVDKQKLNFFLDLFNPKLKEVWECQIFKDSLLEKVNEDELYFFLSCRNYIFKGSCLENIISSSDPVIYITVESAMRATQYILSKYERSVVQKIKFSIQVKKKKKNQKYFIDSHFLLKVFLDIYISERKKKYAYFKASLEQYEFKSKKGEKNISYKHFKKFILTNFNFLTYGEIAEMYRHCYHIGMGSITHQILFNYFGEALFIRQLKENPILPLYKLPAKFAQKIDLIHEEILKCRYLTQHINERGLEKLTIFQHEFKKFTELSVVNECSIAKVAEIFKFSHYLNKIRVLQLLKGNQQSCLNQELSRQLVDELEAQFQNIRNVTRMNKFINLQKNVMKKAAHKLSQMFKNKIRDIYKCFDYDINRKLVQLSS